MQGRVLAIANQKGGVGKTTTSVNLAASLAETGRKIMLVDLDPQGNATMGSGINKYQLEYSVYDVLTLTNPVKAVVLNSPSKYDLLPANSDLTAAEVELVDAIGREMRLKKSLDLIKPFYDFILIDCPPSLNLLTINALTAAQGVIIPMQCEYYALEGLASLLDTIESIKQVLNPELEVEGLLRTMFDPRNSLSNEVSKQLLESFPDKVYRSVIPRNVRLAEAPSHSMPVLQYDKRSKGAIAYLALAGEVLRRQNHYKTKEKVIVETTETL